MGQLMNMFKIILSNGRSILFEDIIKLNKEQRIKILSYAKSVSQVAIQNSKSCRQVDIGATEKKKMTTIKERVLQGKNSKEIFNEQIVKFTSHSVDRMMQRYQGNLTEIYFSIIEMIKQAEEISNQAEWKGYKSLTY